MREGRVRPDHDPGRGAAEGASSWKFPRRAGNTRACRRRGQYVLRAALPDGARVKRAEIRKGKGEWKKARCRTARECLAGTVRTATRFAEVRVEGRREAVAARFTLDETVNG